MLLELFPKQEEFFLSENRINTYIGGIQSGKTSGGAAKMVFKGILKYKDPEDNFIIAADTYKTLSQATLPKFMKYAKPYGTLNRTSGEFKTHWGSTVYLRTGTDPESMEGITNVRRIWIDEGGKVSRYFFENVMGRAAFKQCPIDITTTPYALNWLAELCKASTKGIRDDVSVVNCRSIDSPYFPKSEYERQKKLLDPRRFSMKYEGVFGKMEGLVYDIYDDCLTNSFQLPPSTTYYAGLDWGYSPDPFAFVIRAITPEKIHYRTFEYYRNFLTISDICNVVRGLHNIYKFKMVYCDPSQPAHIAELNRNGVPAVGSDNEIRFGLDKHYTLMKEKRFFIFKDMNPVGIDEYSTYSYREPKELGPNDDSKKNSQLPVGQNDHGLDADRYITVETEKVTAELKVPIAPRDGQRPQDLAKKIEWLKRGGTRQWS